MAIRMDTVPPQPFRRRDDVTIVWKGGRIAKLLFPSGKVVCFDSDDDPRSRDAGGSAEPPAPPVA